MSAADVVAVRDLSMSFNGVAALSGVSLSIGAGEARGLVGENGAGKSTLINIVSGALQPDSGTIEVAGEEVSLRRPQDALLRGIGTVHQQNWLIPGFTAAQNVDLGFERTRTPVKFLSRGSRPSTDEALEFVGLGDRAGVPVGDLRLADRQLVAIARALSYGTRLLIFDEPTASLTPVEIRYLFEVIDRLREATVMRAGRMVGYRPSSIGERELVRLMAGEDMPEQEDLTVARRRERTAGRRQEGPLLVGEGLTDSGGTFRSVDLSVRAGEVLALVGLPDSGATELTQAIAGARRLGGGTITLDGKRVQPKSPRRAVRSGIAYLAGDRKLKGVIPNSTVAGTVTLSALHRVSRFGLVGRRRQEALARELIDDCKVKTASTALPITALSGGNQQKALFARTIATKPKVIVCEDPTAGVDPGGREALYELLSEACAQGDAVLFTSSDLREVATLSDRVLVLWRGEIVAECSREELSVSTLMNAQFNQSTEPEVVGSE
jgi:ABC-type sugar transport system ATPase subunit